jgi:hypothetical protein
MTGPRQWPFELLILPGVRPPFGWKKRDEPERTLFVGYDFGVAWPFAALYVGGMALGYPTLCRSVAFWCVATALAALLALLRGFRLEVSRAGFTLWRTWCWIPYWRKKLPLIAEVTTAGGFGDPPDRMVIERALHSEDITLGSTSTCEALCDAVQVAKHRWFKSA